MRIIKEQAAIDISVSDEGYIVLKQKNGGAEPHVVVFAPVYSTAITDAIGSLQEIARAKFDQTARGEEHGVPASPAVAQQAGDEDWPGLVHDA